MKPPAATVIETVGTLATFGEDIDMGIDPENIEHIRMLLTDIYSDRYTAPIREYSTNAWDAHAMVGNTEPIQVTLPDAWDPFLKVRDFGPGMSYDLLSVTFSQYGSSTKRGENVSNGMFGIGGKAGLTYNNQFTVTSWYNGEKIIVEISRASGSTKMKPIYRGPSTERSGVEISVPVKGGDAQYFATAAAKFYRWWKPGTVLVNGMAPAQVSLTHVVDNIHTTTDLGFDVVVMGNVPYPVDRRLYKGIRPYSNPFDIVAFVEIGEVDIPPNREALLYTDKTDAAIADLSQKFVNTIQGKIIDDIDSAPNHAEAYKTMVTLGNRYGSLMPSTPKYKGVDIPTRFKFPHAMWNKNAWRHAYTTVNHEIEADTLINRSMVITNYPGLASLPKMYKQKIDQWKGKQQITATYHLFVSGGFTEPWIDPARIVDWTTIKAEVLPNSGGPSGPRKKPTINVFDTATGYTVAITDLDPTKVPVYVSPTAKTGSGEARNVYAALPHVQIVELGENRWDKFKRENPKAIPLKTAIEKAYAEARDALTAKDIEALSLSRSSKERLGILDHTQIDDPALAATIEICNGTYKSATLDTYNKVRSIARRYYISTKDWPQERLTEKYLLLPSYGSGTMMVKHITTYLNACYREGI